ncbi:ATP-binding cassette domain-containing protein [Nesterenkonia marinintestina]|uniref:ATP-binding cassette domain-containing protein n=1 Tax=Nesterenkonia marinintestina TaxID=2979865 RepID=UPI0021BE6FEE|nr:ATP-binding cassette domain-containing protein [Nesterenkonia sp. GX14115]
MSAGLDDTVGTTTRGAELRATGWTYRHAERDAPAVAGLDLRIAAGERVLIAGASGAGKSTFLHAAAGVLHADEAVSSGSLLVDGMSPEDARGRVGLVQQDPEAQVVLSRIGDDVAFAAENLAVPREEIWARVREAMALVGLDTGLDHPTAQLSGGQKQRLALAGILAMRPGMLLLDEVTAHLDPDGVAQIRDAVVDVAASTGATLVVVEHRLEPWIDHVDTLVVLDSGGGVRRRVPASALREDADLRAELVELGLWVPGHDPAAALPTWRRTVTGGPLLTGEGLAVSRTPPRRSWRRTPPPTPVLEDVDVALHRGQALGIVGRNGAGKSTLLLSLVGLIPVHGGTLRASEAMKREHGAELADSPHRWGSTELITRIGTVFQEPEHQFVRGTVREELALGLRRAEASEADAHDADASGTDGPDADQRVEEMLRRLRLDHLAEQNPFTLSGGEKRRLSVGTALICAPEILMLDEPTFGQDAHTFAELAILLREHLDRGGTVVAVTHEDAFLRALDGEEFDVGPRDGARPGNDDAPRSAPMLSGVRSAAWLGRRNPVGKLAAVLLVTAALVSTMDWVSSAVVVAASFALLPVAGIRVGQFLLRVWPFAVGGVLMVWSTALAGEDSGAVLLDLGYAQVSEGSLELGVALGVRAFAIVLPAVLVFSTTDPTDLADSLAQDLRLPARFVLGALAGMRLLGLLAQRWTTIGHARRARGITADRGIAARLRAFGSQSFGLLVSAIRTATRLAVTMESRGFGAGPRSWARPSVWTGADVLVVLGGVVVAAAALAAAVLAGTYTSAW